jgi:hypothetical protein
MTIRNASTMGDTGIRVTSRMGDSAFALPTNSTTPDQIPGLIMWLDASVNVQTDGAAQFTAASSQFLNITNNASLTTGNINYTYAGWVYLDSKTTSRGLWGRDGQTSSFRENGLRYNQPTDRFVFNVWDGASSAVASVTANALGSPSTATWYFIVCGFDLANNRSFISVNDGTVNTTTATGTPGTNTGTFEVGKSTGAAIFQDGRIDSLGFWKRVLTADEITWLYNSGNGRIFSNIGQSGNNGSNLLTSLISWWDLDESSGTRADSFDANNLTSNNSVGISAGIAAGNASNGDTVKQWSSIVGGVVYSQSTVSTRPIYLSTGANGRPTLRFDGTDDFLTGDANSKALIKNLSGVTIFAVISSNANQLGHVSFWSIAANDNVRLSFLRSAGGNENYAFRVQDADGSTTVLSPSKAYTLGVLYVMCVHHAVSDAVGTIFQSGSKGPTSTSGFTAAAISNTDSNSSLIGKNPSASCFNGDIAEIIVYNRAVSPSERVLLERFLGAKYGVSIIT